MIAAVIKKKTGRVFLIINSKCLSLKIIKGLKTKTVLKTAVLKGKNGFSIRKREGDMKTPVGIFSPQFAFGISDRPQTELEYVKINESHYFVDDSNSKFYNKLIDKELIQTDFKSAEHLIDYKKEYKYAVLIGYNRKCKRGRGSAVFLHCKGEKPYTAGCIAIEEKDMLTCLKYLNKKSKIIIIP